MSAAHANDGDLTTDQARSAELLAEELESASRDLMAATSGSSLCTFSKRSGPVPAAKYHEGRWAALREVSRVNAPGNPDRVEVALRIRGRWAAQLADLHIRDAGPDWIAYRSGGVDALDHFIGRMASWERASSSRTTGASPPSTSAFRS